MMAAVEQKAQIETLAGDCEMFDTFAMQQATMNGMLREIGGTRRMDTSRCRIVAASVCVNPLSRKVMMGIRIDTLAGTLDAEHRLVEEIRESGAVLRGMRAVAVCGDDVASALPVILDVAFDNAAIANVCEGEPFEVRAASGVGEVDRVTDTKIVTPMQATVKTKENDNIVELPNPFFWAFISKKKFYNDGEQARPSVHFEEKYYVDESNQPGMNSAIMTHEYAFSFFNINDFNHHSRTGARTFMSLGATDPHSGDNGRQCKLGVSLYDMY
eukprot:jgi/Phyca11/17199/fgenesh1_pg.PHYCAscaffold_26_\